MKLSLVALIPLALAPLFMAFTPPAVISPITLYISIIAASPSP
jgi:hypothetical protein